MPSLIKQLKWFLVDQFMLHISGGGGGGSAPAPAPSSQTVSNTSIPAYAQPYVETMLGQSQALTDINQNPYQTYGGSRIAEFSPLQQQAFANVANQTTATQLGTGTDLASQAGYGSLAATGQVPGLQQAALNYGQAGQMYGDIGAAQAAQAAQQAQRSAGMYGRQGAGYGAQAAGLAPQAQMYGQNAANIGMGGLGYGAMGAGYGAQGANMAGMGFSAGDRFAQQATDPNSVAAYMSPYVEQALAPQLKLLNQEQMLQAQGINAKAVGAGAFGGNRATLAQGLNAQNFDLARQQAIGQGYEKAFQNAQAQQQFGANLGLQGLQAGYQGLGMGLQGAQSGLSGLGTAMQGQQAGLAGLGQAGSLYGQGMQGAQTGLSAVGQQLGAGQLGLQGSAQGIQGAQAGLQGVGQGIAAGQYGLQGLGQATSAAGALGQLGQTQFGQQQAINQAQQTTGAVQQAQAQQALDQAYQDFMKQKNYPYQQLAFMSDMLRGLPLSQSAQTQYTAPPNAASQLGGLGMSALGIYGMSGGFKQANGGVVKAANGGLMAAKAYKEGGYAGGGQPMSGEDIIKQLTAMLDNPELTPQEVEAIEKKIMTYQRMLGNPQAEEIIAPAVGRSGIAAIGTGNMVPDEVPAGAGGGIVAFARGGSPNEYDALEKAYFDKALQRLKEPATTGDPFAESKATESDIRAQLAENKRVSPYEALAMAGLGTMAGTSPHALTNLGLGGIQGLKSMAASKSEQDQLNKLLLQQGVEREKSQFARQMAREGQADTAIGALIGKRSASELAAATRASSGSNTSLANTIKAQSAYDTAINNEKRRLLELNKATYGDMTSSQLDSDAKANVDAKLTPAFKALIQLPTEQVTVPTGSASNPLPMPKTAADAIKGKVYNTKNGPATWDGKQFVGI